MKLKFSNDLSSVIYCDDKLNVTLELGDKSINKKAVERVINHMEGHQAR